MPGRTGNFTLSNGMSVKTVQYRLPTFIPKSTLDTFFKRVITAYENNPRAQIDLTFLRNAIGKSKKPIPDGKPIYITSDDIEMANAASVGFISYKMGIKETPSSPKGEETTQLRQQLLDLIDV